MRYDEVTYTRLPAPVKEALQRRADRERRSLSGMAALLIENALRESGDFPPVVVADRHGD